MPEFARWLSHQIGSGMLRIGNGIRATPSPVADKTGLTERYDFTFEYRGIPLGSILPVQLTAVQESLEKQLGLKLVKAKVSVNTLIIDHVDKIPSAN